MRLKSHGASLLNTILDRGFHRVMAAFAHTSPRATIPMRDLSAKAVLTNSISIAAHTACTHPERLWHTGRGIVFSSSPIRTPNSSRTVLTATAPGNDGDVSNQMSPQYVNHGSASSVIPGIPMQVEAGLEPATADHKESKHVSTSIPANSRPPQSDSSFKVSEPLFRKAKEAAPGTAESFWSHAIYRGPIQQRVKVHYCRSKHTAELVLQKYFVGKRKLGFDLEWVFRGEYSTGIKHNVSLIQIACEDRIALIHVALFQDAQISCPPTLKQILEDREVTKIGVAIKADCARFRKYLEVDPKGLFELSHLYKLIKYSESKDYKQINKKLVSLAQQVEEHLHLPLFKGSDVRSSDWSQPIQMSQIMYASADAYAGLQLFETMDMKRKALNPSPPCPYNIDDNKPIRLADGITLETDETEETVTQEARLSTPTRPMQKATVSQEMIETMELDPDCVLVNDSVQHEEPTTKRSKESKPSPKQRPSKLTKSPIVLEGDSLAQSYRSAHPEVCANPSALRAYYIWYHNPALSISEIAALLREPPLQTSTVTSYILDAIRLEQLSFDKSRLRLLLEMVDAPNSGLRWRFRSLIAATKENV